MRTIGIGCALLLGCISGIYGGYLFTGPLFANAVSDHKLQLVAALAMPGGVALAGSIISINQSRHTMLLHTENPYGIGSLTFLVSYDTNTLFSNNGVITPLDTLTTGEAVTSFMLDRKNGPLRLGFIRKDS